MTETFARTSSIALVAAAVAVVGYWAYTLLEWRWLRPVVDPRARQLAVGGALGLSLGSSLFHLEDQAVTYLVTLGVCIALVAYAWRRQWLVPIKAAQTAQDERSTTADKTLVVALPSGDAMELPLLARVRTAWVTDLVVVHCGLSLATAAFRPVPPKEGEKRGVFAAWLPHQTGFWIGDAKARWDGVDGAAHGRHERLERVPVVICTHAAWRRAHPDGRLLVPLPRVAPRTGVSALTRSARGVEDGGRLGEVVAGTWRPLAIGALDRCNFDQADRYYLARWAANARGLAGSVAADEAAK